jgi:manganese oxidase
MHLHGAFYQVLSLGNFETDTAYADGERQSVVTQNLRAGNTMMLEWTPEHAGRWLFHCHFHLHVSSDERVPVLSRPVPGQYDDKAPSASPARHQGMDAMNDMAGLVLMINVKASPSESPPGSARAARKIDLVIEPDSVQGKSRTFSCSVREGKKIEASAADKSAGPPIVLTRGEPVEITVVNHLDAPTTIHWHGLELDSFYDGVVGGGAGDQVTPAIKPGASFVVRFTPDRAGTFIYHTHAADPKQISGGVYGGLIVLEPGDRVGESLPVLLVADLFHPVHNLTVELFLNGDVRHRRVWTSPMPVLLAWRKPHHITRADFFDWPAQTLCPAAACRHNQGLPERMRMPCSSRARLERYACPLNKCWIRRLK